MILSTIHVVAHCVNFYKIAYIVDATVLLQLGLLKPGETPKTPWYAFIPPSSKQVPPFILF